MKTTNGSLVGLIAALTLAGGAGSARAAPATLDRNDEGSARFGTSDNSVSTTPSSSVDSTRGPAETRAGQRQPGRYRFVTYNDDRWRYQWYNGRWWYWLPSNRWVYYSGGGWRSYAPGGGAVWYWRSYPRGYYSGYRGYYYVDPNGYRAWSRPYYSARPYYRVRRVF